MKKQEILTMKEVYTETNIPVNTLLKHWREGKLKGVKNGRSVTITREHLNDYLGITNDDEIIKKDYEIQRLKDRIKGYEIQLESFKSMAKVLMQAADIHVQN